MQRYCTTDGCYRSYGNTGGRQVFHIFSFAAVLFLSGIIFSANERFGIFVRKKVKRLLIPYLCLGVPLVITSFITRAIEGGISSLTIYKYWCNL